MTVVADRDIKFSDLFLVQLVVKKTLKNTELLQEGRSHKAKQSQTKSPGV